MGLNDRLWERIALTIIINIIAIIIIIIIIIIITIAAQDQAIRTNYIKATIDKSQLDAKCQMWKTKMKL